MPSLKKTRLAESCLPLGTIGEFGLIKRLRTRHADSSPEILKGIGDDAAAVKIKSQITLITTDMLLEGIHFNLSFTTFYQLGYKTLAVNISDILAMGGKPRYFLLGLGLPATYLARDIDELYSGIMKLAKKFKVAVIGGDTCASGKGLVLSGTLLGEANGIITRSGARPGDAIFVTDTIGDSAMGLMLMKKLKIKNSKALSPDIRTLIKKHLMPEPRALKKTSGITSMIDVSDGLLIDLSHICDESNAGALIYIDKIPISKGLALAAKKMGADPLEFALKGGEDYILLFTAPSDIKINAIRIGEIIKKGRFLVDARGRKIPFKAEGYEHFK
ncbi:MAG: thiamine-phosphate kinase [Nitrospirota bacterium]